MNTALGDAAAVRAGISEYFASGGDCEFDEQALLVRFDQFYAESEEIIPNVARAFAGQDFGKSINTN